MIHLPKILNKNPKNMMLNILVYKYSVNSLLNYIYLLFNR